MPAETAARIRSLVSRCDLAVVDLDQCLVPRFTQTRLGRKLLAGAFRGTSPALRAHLPRLIGGAGFIVATRLRRPWKGKPGNRELMEAFIRVLAGLPLEEVEAAASGLPGRSGPWRSALGRLEMPVFLLTASIEPVARAYGSVAGPTGPIFSGWKGTPLRVRRGLVADADWEECLLEPADKKRWLEARMAAGGYRRPLIIGHGRDEEAMAALAARAGGGSIAVKRWGSDPSGFGIVLGTGAWRAL
ncbi:MAG TPA: hypothetical protein PK636_03900, partial [bacterium]|nr:hypothetical protein [bacterium]